MYTKCAAALHQRMYASAPASEAAEIAYKEQQDFYVGHDGGYMIPIHSKIAQGTRNSF